MLRAALPLAAVVMVVFRVCLPGSAAAFTLRCIDRDALLDSLAAANGEASAHAGVASNGALLEVTVNPDGGWTAFFTFPDGLACPIAGGEGWRDAPAIDDDPAA